MSQRDAQGSATAASPGTLELAHEGYRLQVLSGELRGREIEVLQERVRIGRSRSCEVTLPDVSVSRIHVEIQVQAGRYRLLDNESTGGCYLNGSRVADAFLQPGDELKLGQVELRFVPRGTRASLLPSEAEQFGPVLGRSLAMREVFGVLERVAQTDAPLLVQGETGTGKDLVARALHEASTRRQQPFVIVDSGAIGAAQLEAELFGVTGDAGQPGALRLADGGTLVLDEIELLPQALQPKLLRVFDSGRFRRGGEAEEQRVDVRVIALASRDLGALAESESFRQDLYYRVSVVSVVLPPLRERREDIPMLIEAFSRRLPPGLWRAPDAEAMARLVGYAWPGNVRELRNIVERSAYLSPDGVIDLMTRARERSEPERVEFDPTLKFREQKERAVERFEEAYLHWLLERAGGNISRGAREADMDRKHLHKLLRRYGIDAKQYAKR